MVFPTILVIVGFAYVVIFGGMGLLRGEGLSLRLALESAVLIALAILLAFAGVSVHPVAFLIVLYLVTMRVRLLVELATAYAKAGRFATSERLFALALRLWPDPTSRLIVKVNHGTSLLQQGKLDDALAEFKEVLEQKSSGLLGRKCESATYYNLGLVYLRKNMEAQAIVSFNQAIDAFPASEYARRAARALERKGGGK